MMLARNLALLEPVKEQMKPTPHHFAALINMVMTVEHAYLEVERLVILADEPARGELKQDHREEFEVALRALDRALAQRADEILDGLLDPQDSEQWVTDLRLNIRPLDQLRTQTLLACNEVNPSSLSIALGFIDGLEAIGNLLDSRERPSGSASEDLSDAEADLEPRPFFDPVAFRFSVKLGAAITLGLIVGLTTQRADLQTILWSTVVAGQPNQYGAVIRKTILRLGGRVLGGLTALAAMILVSENFDAPSLPRHDIRRYDVLDLHLAKQRVAGLCGHPARHNIPDLLCRARTIEQCPRAAVALLGNRVGCADNGICLSLPLA
jgi:hypothetical protein